MASSISNNPSVPTLAFPMTRPHRSMQTLVAHVKNLSNLTVTIKKIEEVVECLNKALYELDAAEGLPFYIKKQNTTLLIKKFNDKLMVVNSELSGSSITPIPQTVTTSTSLKESQTKTIGAEKTFSFIVRLLDAKQKLLKIIRISYAVLEDYNTTYKEDGEKIKPTAGIVVQNAKNKKFQLTMTYLPNRSAITGIPEFLPLIENRAWVDRDLKRVLVSLQQHLISLNLSDSLVNFYNTRFIAAIQDNPVRKKGVLKIQEFDSDHAKCLDECIPKMPPEMINLIGHYWAPNETFIYLDKQIDGSFPMYPFCPREIKKKEAMEITEKVDIPKTFPDVDLLDGAYNQFGIVLRGMHKKTNEAVILWAAPGSAEFKMLPATVSRETTITNDCLIRMTLINGDFAINGSNAETLNVPFLILKVPNDPALKMIAEADLLNTFPDVEILEGAHNDYGVVFLGIDKETQHSMILWAPLGSNSFRAFRAKPTIDGGSILANGLIEYRNKRINDYPSVSLDVVALGLRNSNSESVTFDTELPAN